MATEGKDRAGIINFTLTPRSAGMTCKMSNKLRVTLSVVATISIAFFFSMLAYFHYTGKTKEELMVPLLLYFIDTPIFILSVIWLCYNNNNFLGAMTKKYSLNNTPVPLIIIVALLLAATKHLLVIIGHFVR